MEKLIKHVVRIGNSAGVVLPKKWLNGEARVELIHKPINIKEDVLEILSPYLKNISGIYLTGSYARNEQTKKSDIDVLVIGSGIDKQIKKGKYNIIIISEEKIEEQNEKNALPVLPMLKEAKVILNAPLIKNYRKSKITKKNVKWHVETTKSALKLIREFLDMNKKINEKPGKGEIYSLILRLRTVYIINCLRKNKKWSKKELLSLIKEISGSLKAYEAYENIKNNEKINEVRLEELERLYKYLEDKTRILEKWIKKEKRD